MESMNFLIVDDSAIMIKNITKMLEEQNHKVVGVAKNGKDGIEEYNKCLPDMVTMDITMPDMDGITAVRKIIEEYKDAKIIMVTSHGQENMVIEAIQAGAVGYILKPLKADKLQEVIEKVYNQYFTK